MGQVRRTVYTRLFTRLLLYSFTIPECIIFAIYNGMLKHKNTSDCCHSIVLTVVGQRRVATS